MKTLGIYLRLECTVRVILLIECEPNRFPLTSLIQRLSRLASENENFRIQTLALPKRSQLEPSFATPYIHKPKLRNNNKIV